MCLFNYRPTEFSVLAASRYSISFTSRYSLVVGVLLTSFELNRFKIVCSLPFQCVSSFPSFYWQDEDHSDSVIEMHLVIMLNLKKKRHRRAIAISGTEGNEKNVCYEYIDQQMTLMRPVCTALLFMENLFSSSDYFYCWTQSVG